MFLFATYIAFLVKCQFNSLLILLLGCLLLFKKVESWEFFTYFGKKILYKTCNFQIFSFLGLFDWFSFFIIFSDLTILKAFNVHSFYLSFLKSLIFRYWEDKNTKKYKSIKTMITNISISIILIKKVEYQHYFFQFLYS